MKSMLRILLVALILLSVAGTLVYWWGIPEVVSLYPPDGASDVRASSEIRMEFSKPMLAESVLEHLSIEPTTPGRFEWQERSLAFIPDQPWQAGTAVKVQLEPGSKTSGSLSFHMRQGASWSFRIRQPALAYLYPTGEPANIYALDPLTGESKALTDQPLGVMDFSVDAGGTSIYYSAQTQGGNSAVYQLRLDSEPLPVQPGSTPELAAATLVWECPQALCRLPAVSPQGDWLAYEQTPHPGSDAADFPRVWLLALASNGLPQLAASPDLAGEPDHQTLQPSWSSGGYLSFYDSDQAAFVILDPASRSTSLFSNQTGQPGDWHPGGRYFVAPEINFLDTNISENLAGLQALANSHLLLFDRQQESTQDLSQEIEVEDTSPSFSPDGTVLAFARKYLDKLRWTPGRQIWMMHLSPGLEPGSSSQARPLTASPDFNHYELAWNPNGEQIAYVRFNQTMPIEPPEIWLLDPFTGRTVKLITGGYAPTWIP